KQLSGHGKMEEIGREDRDYLHPILLSQFFLFRYQLIQIMIYLICPYPDIIGKFSAFFYVGIKDATYQFILVVHGGSYPVKDTYQGISPATKNSQFYFLAHKCFSLKVYISISFVLTS